ncbi:UDP-N-acetylmuramoyl-L-alanyl-D-glutamate--2,6-diaminopimelate ligase [Ralstonia insidiosa]|jgi:UDP-N-acetylmuramoyl-L-alanyl-D-glutamate--2,6-diaminopimelate ligase|uniref:UDP-N-acetylmuramoyl-L-alanyl-D-glutamate--2, 6-diaminopimelate ligase n=1 Tax=Ralstonia TaxID=48736 RepID=UPI00066488F9|nr:UDP-N-acetylmuramoyl-L-alanyl-D-glutamate--2,6-diaminopimelate ligase [Ralstonia insidiosa]KMW47505.1 UDP-N-acetylmuramoylalanyl-D-glutamate--2,6-diaminopimelate ligase [Ralstonia sp. MD27]MBX3773762.1 UDP-N-acetylmuramoyl-L-alanyl-D-glutamate--2,6-diaminopimelate ligase [Ralstonia pickettii]NOZ17029.1 UDP-N-acetylmuramoyl-L-alanyl-D-glutamate--2,6-diaminopimelate ligase [Betaproteobacteria bacterium]MBA9857455.1 UDP-N-acetylmuramoyl-L-alanyl-D-glutamate--2,6-diaminopimelate ligase [Ralstoni
MTALPNSDRPSIAARLTPVLDWLRAQVPAGADITSDTRKLKTGDVFVAYVLGNVRQHGDGRPHIPQAIAAGASAVLAEAHGYAMPADAPVRILPVDGLAELAGPLAAQWYSVPGPDTLRVIGVTGTNGKTSCSQWIAQALTKQGERCAVVGTLGTGFVDALVATGFTTPDAIQLQHSLADLHHAGARAIAMEVSSHGLEQGRVDGTRFDIAVFTNLTQDHLDYHGTMAEYELAKARLFNWQGLRAAVINRDDAAGVRLLQNARAGIETIEYGIDGDAASQHGAKHWLRATNVRAHRTGTTFDVDGSFGHATVHAPTVGLFNVSNLLGVLGALLAAGVPWQDAIARLEKLQPVSGRMERFGGEDGPLVVVDYAHTPDALEQTLRALAPITEARGGKLWAVFGCGGDRDPGKRPQMGGIAERLAQHVVLTSDNPRSEDPQHILDEISDGMDNPRAAAQIEDRAAAILHAVRHADAHDVIVVAGKGHESTQEIAGRKRPFSDQEHVRLALAARGVNA